MVAGYTNQILIQQADWDWFSRFFALWPRPCAVVVICQYGFKLFCAATCDRFGKVFFQLPDCLKKWRRDGHPSLKLLRRGRDMLPFGHLGSILPTACCLNIGLWCCDDDGHLIIKICKSIIRYWNWNEVRTSSEFVWSLVRVESGLSLWMKVIGGISKKLTLTRHNDSTTSQNTACHKHKQQQAKQHTEG